MNRNLLGKLEDGTPDVLDKNGCRKQGRGMLGLLLMAVLMAWMVPAEGQTDYSGVYYLSGNNQGQDSYNVANTTTNYYFCPTEDWIYYVATNNFTTSDNGQPFLTTYQYRNGTNDSTKAVWIIKKHPSQNYYYIIHAKDGKYLTANGKITGSNSSNRIRVHLEETNSPNDKMLFDITQPSPYYDISPKENSGWYLNITQGNQNSLQGTDAKSDGPQYTLNGVTSRNVGGTIGLWNKPEDFTSKWYFEEDAKGALTPAISDLNPQLNQVTITWPFVPPTCLMVYTTDGTEPAYNNDGTIPGNVYVYNGTTPLSIPVTQPNTTIKAAVLGYGMVLSNIVSKTVSPFILDAPSFEVNCQNQLAMRCNNLNTARIFYLVNPGVGVDPDLTSYEYQTPLTLLNDGDVVKARAYTLSGDNPSEVSQTTFHPNSVIPTIAFTAANTVSISYPRTATIYYNITEDGSDPATPTTTNYTGTGTANTTLNVTIDPTKQIRISAIAKEGSLAPSCEPATGWKLPQPELATSCDDATLTITSSFPVYYTIAPDLGTPTIESTPYIEPITGLTVGDRLNILAIDSQNHTSYLIEYTHAITHTAPPTIAMTSSTTITITGPSGSIIHYTIDGDDPEIGATGVINHSSPVTIDYTGNTMDIRALAKTNTLEPSCVTQLVTIGIPTITISADDCTEASPRGNVLSIPIPTDGSTIWYAITVGENSAAPDPEATPYSQYTDEIVLDDLDGANTYYRVHAYAKSSDESFITPVASENCQMKTGGKPVLTEPSGSSPVVVISGGVFGDVAVCTVGDNTINVPVESDGTAEYTIPSGASGTLTVAFKHGDWLVSCEATYTLPQAPATPTWSQECDNRLSLHTESPMAEIHYILNGEENDEVTLSSPTYTEGCLYNISAGTRVRAKAFEGFLSSGLLDYTYQPLHVAVPQFFVNGTEVTISGPSGTTVRYTTSVGTTPGVVPSDPADPDASSTPVNGFITIAGGNIITVFKAIAIPDDHPEQASCVARVVTREGYSINSAANLSLLSTNPNSYFFLFVDIDATGFTGTVNNFTGTLDGNYHTISNLSVPLFNTITSADPDNNAAVLNVMFKDVHITTDGNAGTIANTATGYSRIYNCGILPDNANGTTTSYISGTANVGGLVGELSGTARVINCFSYANITGGAYRGGIVGNNNVTTASHDVTNGVNTMIMNCMFYGDIASGGTVIAPIYGGTKISNSGSTSIKGLNNYNYFRFNKDYVANITDYNCALGAQDRFLVRFEFFRNILNSNRELAMWYVSGSVADAANEMAHWVLDKSVAPYPILKKPGQTYPSLINPDAAHAIPLDPDNEHRNEGRKLGVLRVNINNSNTTTGGATAPSTINIAQSIDINITDKDVDNYNFNYYKIQLPYYNEIVGANGATNNNYTGKKVVTGWKITGFVGGTPGSLTTGSDVVFEDGNIVSTPYNFVDRACTNKDKYSSTNKRVFNQGAYYEVPDGVTEITIEPYWANCVYLSDATYDVTFDGDDARPVDIMGDRPTSSFNNDASQTVYTSFSAALTALSPVTSATVYDYAIVLVGNYHEHFGGNPNGASENFLDNSKEPFTVMSADMDGDNEPDNTFFYQHTGRKKIYPVRFDFINIPGIGIAQKEDGAESNFQVGIFHPKGWFEITNTVLIHFGQFEYADSDNKSINAPLILQGGIYEQFVSSRYKEAKNTTYLIIGGNAWFKNFNNGCHTSGGGNTSTGLNTPKVPINIAGGDYENFYLSGVYRPQWTGNDDSAECYIDGGRFGEVAGAGMQVIKGNVTWLINAADVKSFFGGGINNAEGKSIEGNITTVISNSYVDEFCGGPKFGNMKPDKTVKTTATDCHFGNFFGAGYGGTAVNRVGVEDYSVSVVDYTNWNVWVNTYYSREYQTSQTTNIPTGTSGSEPVNAISTSYEYEYMFFSGGESKKKVCRFYINFATLSLASTNDVTSTLTGCTIDTNFYGGGKFGYVNGDAVSTLTDCTVKGDAFGSGFSAAKPTCEVMPEQGFNAGYIPHYDNIANVFNDEQVEEYGYPTTVTYTWKQVSSVGTGFSDVGGHYILTTEDLDHLGTVRDNATLTINGNSVVKGDVYGGGALSSSGVGTSGGKAQVNINGGTYGEEGATTRGNIYGGGKGDRASLATPEDPNHKDTPVTEDQVEVNIGNADQTSNNVVIYGSVYGGNNINGTPKNDVVVHVYKTKHNSSNVANNLTGSHAIKEVFGGGNKAHYRPTSANKKTTVHIHNCDNTIEYVYGGGNAADVGTEGDEGIKSATDVIIDGGRIKWVFGGGNGYSETDNHTNYYLPDGVTPDPDYNPGANIYGVENEDAVKVTFHAGHITYFFGGSNEWGEIIGNKNIDLRNDGTCSNIPENHIVELYGGNNKAPINNNVGVTFNMPCTDNPCQIDYLFGGSRMANISGDVTLNVHGGLYNYVFGGNNISGEISGNVTLNLFGGTINEGAFGGNNEGGEIKGKITVNMLQQGECSLAVHNIYGGGYNAAYEPTVSGAYPEVNLIHGTVSKKTDGTAGNVYGGGYGSTATVTSNPVVNVGYDASMATLVSGLLPTGTSLAEAIVNVEGNVYGGGNLAPVSGYTSVTMQEAASTSDFTASTTVGGDIYGGGNLANVSASTTVNVTGGTVTHDVYGGGAFANVGTDGNDNTTVTLSGGTVNDIYGGGLGDASHPAAVNGPVQVTVNGGTVRDVFGCNNVNGAPQSTVRVDINNNVTRNVYGGGNLANCEVSPIVYINNGTVGGSVFGGGLGASAIVAGSPSVTIGTANSSDGYQATVSGDVYGGGDMANVRGKTTVLVQKCNTVINGDVYGGGNAAHIWKDETEHLGTTSVTVTGGTINNYNQGHGMVFGGGHGDRVAGVSANVADSTYVTINGGTIYQVYGGSNSLGSIKGGAAGGINVLVNKTDNTANSCKLHINELYGGGNYAASQAGDIDIRCTGNVVGENEGINYVYGGANRADVTGPITLNITEGRIDYVFGGNNNDGSITNGITVNIEKKADPCVWEVGDVFGGGNLAIYGGTPVVNVKNGTVANVYGGGNGDPNSTTQEPGQVAGTNVTIGDATEGYCAVVTGNVYGGGNAAKVDGNTIVTYNDENTSTSVAKLFGGGNQAGVTGTTTVTLANGTVNTGVYGGCNEKGNVDGNITVTVNGGTVGSQANLNGSGHITGDVFGGGYGGYVDAANPGTTTSGDVLVNINNGTIWGNVYGGSAFGDVNAAGKTTTVNIMGGTLETFITQGTTAVGLPCNVYHGGNVFGGGLGQKEATGVTPFAAKVNGTVEVNIGKGTLVTTGLGSDYNLPTGLGGSAIIKGNVYGCNNQNGSPQDNVVVNVFQTGHPETTGGYALHDVFGGGNQADFRVDGKTATVNIYTCVNTIERTFSGGNAAATNSVRTMIQGGRIREVYGGGNGEVSAANVNGTATLDIHGGQIGQSYAGSNQQGSITQGSTVNADDLGPCGGGTNVNEFFCGGNYANYIGNINATITCNGRMNVDNLYGGCNQAHVVHKGTPGDADYEPGNITLTVYGGNYKNIYGGSKGTPTKGADVEGSIILNIHGGTITEAIFGGSNIKGAIGGTITVNVEDYVTTDQCPLDVTIADVYGGGNMADYPGVPAEDSPITAPINHPDNYNYPMINIKNATVKNVFGGGLKAEVKGNPQIKLKNKAKVLGNVYGGGNMGEVVGSPKVTIDGNDNSANPNGL